MGLVFPEGYNGVCGHDTAANTLAAMGYDEARIHARLLKEHGVTGYKLLTAGANKVDRARGYVDEGLLVAVRFYVEKPWGRPPGSWVTPGDQIRPYVAAGVQLMELGWNEPNISEEWVNGPPGSYNDVAAAVVAAWEVGLARAVEVPGLVPLFPAHTPSSANGWWNDHRAAWGAMRRMLEDKGLMGTVQHVACHPRPLNNPPDTQWTAANTCTWDEWRWFLENFAPGAYYWATEHGYSLGDDQNHDWPQIDLAKWEAYNWELFVRMNPAHPNAHDRHMAGVFYWVQDTFGYHLWRKDALVGSCGEGGMPDPSPLWRRMQEHSSELAFSRYSGEAPPIEPPGERAKGFDVSYAQYDDKVDWEAGVTAGNEFAMIRFLTGKTLDTRHYGHMQKSEGIRYIRFGYDALKPDVDPVYQARVFLGLCRSLPVSGGAVDVEASGTTYDMVGKYIDAWFEQTQVPLGFYSNLAWIAKLTGQARAAGKEAEFKAKLARCWLWLAQWGVDEPDSPAPWTRYTFWQKGQAPGPEYPNPIDRNLYNGTPAQLWEQFGYIPDWCGGGGSELPEPPGDSPRILDASGQVRDWDWLTAEFGLTPANVAQGDVWRVTRLQEGGPSASILVYGPPGTVVTFGWPDGYVQEPIEAKGHRGFGMGAGAYYRPPSTGPHYVTVGDCGVAGLGMLGMTEHRHVDVTVAQA